MRPRGARWLARAFHASLEIISESILNQRGESLGMCGSGVAGLCLSEENDFPNDPAAAL